MPHGHHGTVGLGGVHVGALHGRAPATEGDLALDTGTIDKTGYALGDTVALLTTGPRVEARLVGVFRFGTSGATAGASLAALDTTTAQRLLGVPGEFSGLNVASDDGVSDAVLEERVMEALGQDYAVTTQQEEADDQTASLEEELSFFDAFPSGLRRGGAVRRLVHHPHHLLHARPVHVLDAIATA